MNTEQKKLVMESWKYVQELGTERIGVQLFRNIFTTAPAALQLFSFRDEPDLYESRVLKAHGASVINTIGIAVAGLRDFDSLVPVLQILGRKHIGLGLVPEHFDLVGIELLRTLGKPSNYHYLEAQ